MDHPLALRKATRFAVFVLAAGCVTAPRPLHDRCTATTDCASGTQCLRYGTEAGEGRTCELACDTDRDCPPSLECQVRSDGPPRSCQTPMAVEAQYTLTPVALQPAGKRPTLTWSDGCKPHCAVDEAAAFAERHHQDGVAASERDDSSTAVRELEFAACLAPSVAGSWEALAEVYGAAQQHHASVCANERCFAAQPGHTGCEAGWQLAKRAWKLTHPKIELLPGTSK